MACLVHARLIKRAARRVRAQGMEAYGVRAFADALEVIPSTLAENAGLNPIAIVTELRGRHARGETAAGINVRKVRPADSAPAVPTPPSLRRCMPCRSLSGMLPAGHRLPAGAKCAHVCYLLSIFRWVCGASAGS